MRTTGTFQPKPRLGPLAGHDVLVFLVVASVVVLPARTKAEANKRLARNDRRANSTTIGFRASPYSTTGPALGLFATETLGLDLAGGSAGLLHKSPTPFALDATLHATFPEARRRPVVTFRTGGGLTSVGAGEKRWLGVHGSAEVTWHVEFTPVEVGIDYRPVALFGSNFGWSPLHLGVTMRYRFPSQR